MRNKTHKKFKGLITIILVFLLCINNIAAVVSDNDGSAFITKAEFDSLKNNFQSQIDSYNVSIDSKIDSAISSYLAGITMDRTYTEKRDVTFNWTFPIICMNNSEWNNVTSKYYDYELPDIKDISFSLRGWGNNAQGLSWMSTAPLIATHGSMATGGCVCFQKNWYISPKKYNEMISISDNYINVTKGGSTFKSYELINVGKGRHVTEDYSFGVTRDYGHAGNVKSYWGYSGVIGIGVGSGNGTRSTMTTSTFANWTESQWTRTNGCGKNSELGWGAQTANAFVLPANGLTLDGARTWAENYTGKGTSTHGQGYMGAFANSATRQNTFDWQAGNNIRQWIYTGSSDAPATSVYGWCFDMKKPQTTTEKFEGYYMHYMNDMGIEGVADGTWWGFHSWTPKWFWKFRAAGSIGTNPSSSQFSKLPAKQIFYRDSYKNIHYLDEGLFLLNFRDTINLVEFSAKWTVLDTSLPSGQKIRLKISSKPFDSTHDSNTNLKYKVDSQTTFTADQQVSVGSTVKIKVECDDDVKQLYMMWEPVTSGAYLGLSELSDFTVTIKGQ